MAKKIVKVYEENVEKSTSTELLTFHELQTKLTKQNFLKNVDLPHQQVVAYGSGELLLQDKTGILANFN